MVWGVSWFGRFFRGSPLVSQSLSFAGIPGIQTTKRPKARINHYSSKSVRFEEKKTSEKKSAHWNAGLLFHVGIQKIMGLWIIPIKLGRISSPIYPKQPPGALFLHCSNVFFSDQSGWVSVEEKQGTLQFLLWVFWKNLSCKGRRF